MLAGSSAASRVHTRLAPSRSCWPTSSSANPFKSRFRSAAENFSTSLAQIHQALTNLWPFLRCPESGALEPQIDLIAQLFLGLVKQAQRLINSPLESHEAGLSNSDLDTLGKPHF